MLSPDVSRSAARGRQGLVPDSQDAKRPARVHYLGVDDAFQLDLVSCPNQNKIKMENDKGIASFLVGVSV